MFQKNYYGSPTRVTRLKAAPNMADPISIKDSVSSLNQTNKQKNKIKPKNKQKTNKNKNKTKNKNTKKKKKKNPYSTDYAYLQHIPLKGKFVALNLVAIGQFPLYLLLKTRVLFFSDR